LVSGRQPPLVFHSCPPTVIQSVSLVIQVCVLVQKACSDISGQAFCTFDC
jgi:hypothetical protein